MARVKPKAGLKKISCKLGLLENYHGLVLSLFIVNTYKYYN